jgi:choline dehydrogenase-like flavoprotein
LNSQIALNPDVVIIGAGITGSALADVLAEAGLTIVQLEKALEHKDVVRGEWLAPWGVLEATQTAA